MSSESEQKYIAARDQLRRKSGVEKEIFKELHRSCGKPEEIPQGDRKLGKIYRATSEDGEWHEQEIWQGTVLRCGRHNVDSAQYLKYLGARICNP